jgi:hypothetical protein
MSMATAHDRPCRHRPACAICGATPCLNPSLCRLYRHADAKYAAERQHENSAAVQPARRILDHSISLERAWAELNQRLRSDAPQATVEALVFSLRDGIAALGRPATLRRLSELSAAQLREVAVRVQKFKPAIAQPWRSEDVEVLIVARSRVHG